MAGLIASVLPNTQKVMTAGTSDYNATLRNVDQSQETVSGQLDAILNKDNPYVIRARTSAAGVANSRGLVNSSMAAGAGEAAAIDAALPIATADANTYTTKSRDNQQFQNTAGQFNAGAKNTADLNAAAAGNTSLLSGQEATQQTGLVSAEGAQTRMTETQRAAAQRELETLQAQHTSKLSAQTATQSSTLQREQAAQASTLSAQQAAQAQALQAKAAQSAKELQDAQLQAQKLMQTADSATKLSLANIEADYKTLMQTSASAGDIYKTAIAAMTQVMADPNMDAASKQTGLNNQITILKSSLNFIGSVNGVDVSALLPA